MIEIEITDIDEIWLSAYLSGVEPFLPPAGESELLSCVVDNKTESVEKVSAAA